MPRVLPAGNSHTSRDAGGFPEGFFTDEWTEDRREAWLAMWFKQVWKDLRKDRAKSPTSRGIRKEPKPNQNMLTMNTQELQDKAKYYARVAGLDVALVCAVIEQESNWSPWAIRFEPNFEKKYVDKLHLGVTEAIARSISWGLMQLMGEAARELGFHGKMASLCDPDIGLPVSCHHLKNKLAEHGDDIHAGLQAWNGGGNPKYADEVIPRMENYR